MAHRRGNPEHDLIDEITYDNLGRMNYHPEFHPNHGKSFTVEELIYICKYHHYDEPRSLGFALGRTERAIATVITKLRSDGLYSKYRNYPEDKWERITKCD